MDLTAETTTAPVRRGSPLEVLRIFLKLGLTCFGGQIAQIGDSATSSRCGLTN